MIENNSATNASGIEEKPHLFLGLDYGSSLTKGFYKLTENSRANASYIGTKNKVW
jgi:hypothetical protein